MPYLRYHPASEMFAAERPLRLSVDRFVPGSLHLGSSAVPIPSSAHGAMG